jgi:hypothetical protein
MPATATPLNCNARGMEMTLYYNTGDSETPVWVEHLGITGDLTISEVEDDEEITSRNRERQTKQYVAGETDVNITGTQIMDPAYQGWQTLYSARTHGNPIDIMILTSPMDVIDSVGWRGYVWNKDRTFNGPGTGAQTQAFSLRPAACTDTPLRPVKVTGIDVVEDYDPAIVEAVGS